MDTPAWVKAAQAGDKVVVVNEPRADEGQKISGVVTNLKVGEVYTIRQIFDMPSGHGIGLYIKEVVNPIHVGYKVEYAYHWSIFGPVKDDKLEIFRKMLKPIDELVDA